MAVKKKTTAKKAVKSAPVVKKAAPRVKKAKATQPESFKLQREPRRFLTFKVTDQTIYWAILLVYIMGLSLWVLNIQIDTYHILDSISFNY